MTEPSRQNGKSSPLWLGTIVSAWIVLIAQAFTESVFHTPVFAAPPDWQGWWATACQIALGLAVLSVIDLYRALRDGAYLDDEDNDDGSDDDGPPPPRRRVLLPVPVRR